MITKKAKTTDYFRRHLSPELLTYLKSGPGSTLMEAFRRHGLDVRLRDDYINAYTVGNSLANVYRARNSFRLKVSRKYLTGVELPNQRQRRPRKLLGKKPELPEYIDIDLNETSIAAYVGALSVIRKNAEDHYAKPEARWEERCARANICGCPQQVLDRQIAKGDASKPLSEGRKRRGAVRLDMITVLATPERGLVAVELKRDLDSRIQHVTRQLVKYLEFLDPDGSGLSAPIADSYAIACTQYAELGIAAPEPRAIEPGMPVYGLIGLANYNPRSQLLKRALADARSLEREVRYTFISKDEHPVLPPRGSWNKMVE